MEFHRELFFVLWKDTTFELSKIEKLSMNFFQKGATTLMQFASCLFQARSELDLFIAMVRLGTQRNFSNLYTDLFEI